jgi:hypothetical protein
MVGCFILFEHPLSWHILDILYIYTWSFQILDFLTPNPKKIDFGGWCGKKNTRVVFAVPDTSDVLEWKKAFKKRSKSVQNRSEAFWSYKKRSGVEITVEEFFFS